MLMDPHMKHLWKLFSMLQKYFPDNYLSNCILFEGQVFKGHILC